MTMPSFPYHRFGDFLQKRFGEKVHKVGVDAGFSCPNRDAAGGGGCAWCNNASFNPHERASARTVREQVTLGIKLLRRKLGVRLFLAYFQAYTNTHDTTERLAEFYREALGVEGVVGLAIGTRPDCVDEEKLDLLSQIARTHFVQIEYGLQSANDATLARFQRGHTIADFQQAMELTRGRGLEICGHLIAGLPGETRADVFQTQRVMVAAGITGIKIHNLHVVRGSALGEEYLRAPFALPTQAEHVALVADLLEELPWRVNVQRLWGASSAPELHLAPDWCLNNNAVKFAIETEFRRRGTQQGCRTQNPTDIAAEPQEAVFTAVRLRPISAH